MLAYFGVCVITFIAFLIQRSAQKEAKNPVK